MALTSAEIRKQFIDFFVNSHAHAFVMAVIFLILAHLFAATSPSPAFKSVVLIVAFAGLVGDLFAPWLTRYVAPQCAWLALLSWISQGTANALLIGVSGWECLNPAKAVSRSGDHRTAEPPRP